MANDSKGTMAERNPALAANMRRVYLLSSGWKLWAAGWSSPRGGDFDRIPEADAIKRATQDDAARLLFLLGEADAETRGVVASAILDAALGAAKEMAAEMAAEVAADGPIAASLTALFADPAYRAELRGVKKAWDAAWAAIEGEAL